MIQEKPSFNVQLKEVKENQEDFEWYPTTNEILHSLTRDLENNRYIRGNSRSNSFLDIGAGNGKVLDHVKECNIFSNYYVIEKSQTHLNNLGDKYLILGVDFLNTTLIDKEVDVIFCNPPYSQFEQWATKIIKESPEGSIIYLVIPKRWENSDLINSALQARNSEAEKIGEFDFAFAEDRKARASVHLLKVNIKKNYEDANDPFYIFFNDNFSYPEAEKEERFDWDKEINDFRLVHKTNFIETLCYLYEARMKELQESFQAICKIEYRLLKEFSITKSSLVESMKMKIKTAKREYWNRLFEGLEDIKKRLTYDSRKKIVGLMNDQTGIDFNKENAYAIVIWIIQNANKYFDEQFISTYEKLVEFANIENYVSNQRVFKSHMFYYEYVNGKNSEISHFKIKVGHRIVLEHCGGLYKNPYGDYNNGLSERAAKFIGDIMTIAGNLNYICSDKQPNEREWGDSKAREYYCTNPKGERVCLFIVRAFFNGNMHFQFLPEFIHILNIQYGKLKGWLQSEEDAEKEIFTDEDKKNAQKEETDLKDLTKRYFNHSFKIESKQLLLQ